MASLTSWLDRGFQLKILNTATNGWSDREERIFSRRPNHDDQSAFQERQEEVLLSLVSRMNLVCASTSPPEKFSLFRNFLRSFLPIYCRIESSKGILSGPCDGWGNTGLADSRRSIKRDHRRTGGWLPPCGGWFSFQARPDVPDQWPGR